MPYLSCLIFDSEFRSCIRQMLGIQSHSSMELDNKVHREFVKWFGHRIINDNLDHGADLRALALGPIEFATRFTAYNVNGFKFCTVSRDASLKTQNSGDFSTFGTRFNDISSDGTMQYPVPYYGRLVNVIELNYQGRFKVTLFKCQWENTTNQKGLKKDELGITKASL